MLIRLITVSLLTTVVVYIIYVHSLYVRKRREAGQENTGVILCPCQVPKSDAPIMC